MANGRSGSKKHGIAARGPWLPMPLDFLRSRACAELSPLALKILVDFLAQLGPNATGNGDLTAAPAVLRRRGWVGNGSRVAALQELEDAGLICLMRRGDRRRCHLYALTLFPLDCDLSKLDHGPGAYTTTDWCGKGGVRAKAPTDDEPAQRSSTRRQIEVSPPGAGKPPRDIGPQRDNHGGADPSYLPAQGKQRAEIAPEVSPERDTFLELPSAGEAPFSIPAPALAPTKKVRPRMAGKNLASGHPRVKPEVIRHHVARITGGRPRALYRVSRKGLA